MKHYKYTYEAIDVTTDDGIVLTMFHVTGHDSDYKQYERNETPVLVMHGAFLDGSSWQDIYLPGFGELPHTPLPLHLWQMKFDVWVGNQRGTQYGNPDNLDTPEFWNNQTLPVHALDIQAMIRGIQEATGKS